MDQQALINKLEDQVKKFKSRALKGPEDDKRHDTVRQDEQKSMVTAYEKLGWSFAKIGSSFERDWRTVKQKIESYERQYATKINPEEQDQITTQQEEIDGTEVVKNKKNLPLIQKDQSGGGVYKINEEKKQDEMPPLETNGSLDNLVTSQEDKKNVVCLAPPDRIDVFQLRRQWQVPVKEAPEILRQWRDYHRNYKHDICELFLNLKEDLIERKIPFQKAEAILQIAIKGKKYGWDFADQEVEQARAYRPWEGMENFKATYKEFQELNKPSPLKLEHLNKISELLTRFQKETESAIFNQQWDLVFQLEKDELFFNMLDHCSHVGWHFDQVRGPRYEYEGIIQNLNAIIAQEAPPEASEQFIKSAASYTAYGALHMDLPDYRMTLISDNEWKLTIWDGDKDTDIATGGRNDLDYFKKLHLGLINKHKRDPELKRLVALRKEIRGKLKPLNKEIKNSLDKREYIHSFCLRCPS